MKFSNILVGKTTSSEIKELSALYTKRIRHYATWDEIVIESPAASTRDARKIKEQEGDLIFKRLDPGDFVILLDEGGSAYSSTQFAKYLGDIFHRSIKKICFVTGGAFGFSDKIKQRANATISLSKMTFPHQLVRVIFLEQVYRAFTILNNEKYHHE